MKPRRNQRVQPEFDAGGAPARLAAFISEMKALRVYPGIIWDDVSWDATASRKSGRGHLSNKVRLIFAVHGGAHARHGNVPLSKRASFLSPFADVIKACLVCRYADRGMDPSPQVLFLRAARYLYDALPVPARQDPTLIARGHFVAAEAAALEREAQSSAYRLSVNLTELARTLDRRGLCRALLNFRGSIPRNRDQYDRMSATFEKRTENLPSKDLLEALATIANDAMLKEEPFDLLRMRIVELLVVGGFRIGEALTLPANPLIREPVLDEAGAPKLDAATGVPLERIGIRYWPEKGGQPVPKWVPTAANPLVLRAVNEIDDVCKPARDNAIWLDAHPGQVNLPLVDTEKFTKAEAAEMLGLQAKGDLRAWVRGKGRGGSALLERAGSRYLITGANLKFALAQDRYNKPMLVRSNGRRQSLGESLIVQYMHAGHRQRSVNRFISVPVTWAQIASFLAGKHCGSEHIDSVFERFGLADESGQPYRVKTHDFRRLLNTIAQRGGLTQAEIALWMGRRRVEDNTAYDLRTSVEMAAEMRQLVEKNEVYGIISDQVRALPEVERESFLKDRLTMVHVTHLGRCASNIAENPCATAVSCLGGCGHYLRRKGDAKSRVALQRIEREAAEQLERAKAVSNKGNAANWVLTHETVLKNARAALAIDDDPQVADGELRHVNPGGSILGKPL